MNNSSKKLVGYLAPIGPSVPKTLTPLGLQTAVYGTEEEPYGVEIDERGNAASFQKMSALKASEYVRTSVDCEQRLGDPARMLFVRSADKPAEVIVETFDKMNSIALKAYPDMREEFKRYPVAGFRLAGFVAGLVPGYAAASGRAPELNLDALQFEADLLKMDDETIFQESPEVQRLAKENGITLRGRYGRNPTPPPTLRP